ncbi:hypothetical protein BpHYR1_042582 [Brachionus plicatilis]|uniref:Uncharacterized protein n=1 Tax=Brachionus plicatilis TaxID=10195 RepID=A0A3M7QQM8_BRAPC|nr:hypothetical protein BpHYR1_042582 [Brachionus plicatilis]
MNSIEIKNTYFDDTNIRCRGRAASDAEFFKSLKKNNGFFDSFHVDQISNISRFDFQFAIKFQSFKINSVNAEWCNIQSCINCKSLLMMCKISAKCTTLDYIEI